MLDTAATLTSSQLLPSHLLYWTPLSGGCMLGAGGGAWAKGRLRPSGAGRPAQVFGTDCTAELGPGEDSDGERGFQGEGRPGVQRGGREGGRLEVSRLLYPHLPTCCTGVVQTLAQGHVGIPAQGSESPRTLPSGM